MDGNLLFQRVVAVSGLAELFAAAALTRALERVGLEPATLTRFQLPRAREALQQVLETYLPAPEAAARLAAIESLARAPSASWKLP